MATGSILDALIGNAGDQQTYNQQDPFYMGGQMIAKQQLPQAQTNSEAIFGPLLQGLLAGGMVGYGKDEARQTMYHDIQNDPIMQSYKFKPADYNFMGPPTEAQQSQDQTATALHDYSSPTAPDGWTGKIGKSDSIMATLQQQLAQEEQVRKEAFGDKIKGDIATNALAQGATPQTIQGLLAMANTGDVPDSLLGDTGTRATKIKEAIKTGKTDGLSNVADIEFVDKQHEKLLAAQAKGDATQSALKGMDALDAAAKNLSGDPAIPGIGGWVGGMGRALEGVAPGLITDAETNYDQQAAAEGALVEQATEKRASKPVIDIFNNAITRHTGDSIPQLAARRAWGREVLPGLLSTGSISPDAMASIPGTGAATPAPTSSFLSPGATPQPSVPQGAVATGETQAGTGKPIYILNGVKGVLN